MAGILGCWLLVDSFGGLRHLKRGASDSGFVRGAGFGHGAAPASGHRTVGAQRPATQTDQQVRDKAIAEDASLLAFETEKFNILWTRMKEAQEAKDPTYSTLKKEVEAQGAILESLGGSLPAEMLTLEEAEARAAKLRESLSLDKLLNMTAEERWILAQGLGPAFPIALVLSYTFYWTLNVPFISYAYFTTVATGQTTMGLVMAGAYATSIPFKPLVYIGALLGTPWVAENIMPVIGKLFGLFKLPDAEDWERLT